MDQGNARRVGVVGQSLGALYAPLAAAGEPRLKACIANCGLYDAGRLLPKLPPLHQEVFRMGAHARTAEEAQRVADKITTVWAAERITCPLLVVVGAEDKLVPPSEGERLAKTAAGPTELVVYPERNHVCFNISYKYGPLTADWLAERLIGCPVRNHTDDVIFDRHAEVSEASLEGRAVYPSRLGAFGPSVEMTAKC